jgi:HK97 family phage major capsid protein
MAGIDINRTTAGVVLDRDVSSEIWSNLQEQSAVMAHARQIALPGPGVTVPIITGDAEAEWVAETAEKPVSRATLGSKVITPYKLAVIEPFSNEFRRDLPGLYAELARRLPGALAKKFDQTVFHATTAPGSGFDLLSGATALTLDGTNTYDDLVAVDGAIAAANGVLNGWVLSPKARGVLLGAKDSSNRPLLLTNIQTEGAVTQLLGAPVSLARSVYKADGAGDQGEVLGFAGDWSSAMYGTVEGIQIDVSDQATINDGGTQLNLWQRNMFAIRAEIEVGFAVRDLAHFVKVVGSNSVA